MARAIHGITNVIARARRTLRAPRCAASLALASAAMAACQDTHPRSAAADAFGTENATTRGGHPSAPDAKATPEAPPVGTLEHAVYRAAARYAAGWETSETVFRGSLEPRGRQSFMAVLRYGRCYRFIGAADAEVTDLDLVLYDPLSLPVQRDLSQDNLPVLGQRAHICPQNTGAYRLEVAAYAGAGDFVVQLYESPH